MTKKYSSTKSGDGKTKRQASKKKKRRAGKKAVEGVWMALGNNVLGGFYSDFIPSRRSR